MLKNLVKDLKPSSTLAINETSKQLEQQGKKIFKFGFGQSPFKVPEDVVDNLKWNGEAKKSGFEMGDYISEFKIENSDRPSKNIVYPIAILLLIVFGYFNLKRKE